MSGGPASADASLKSLFGHITEAPADPILGTTLAFNADSDSRKVNLGVGAYRTSEGKPFVLPVVHEAEKAILEATGKTVFKEYSVIDGPADLKKYTQHLVFGEDSPVLKEGRVVSSQVLSGTGGLRVLAEFVKTYMGTPLHTIYVSDPTWGNHPTIFEKAGLSVKKYPYWDGAKRALNIDGMLAALKAAPRGSMVLLHACAHNPTGVDPTPDQWNKIMDVVEANRLVPLLDSAYQGYASGDLDADGATIRAMVKRGFQCFICQSFAKNLGLYGERIGMVHIVTDTADEAKKVLSQLKMVIRPMYSSPPVHGALLVAQILGDKKCFEQWKVELKGMADRILSVRKKLREGLEKKGTPGTWNHITDQIGMFSFTGLTEGQCERLIKQHHIYLLKSGRISLAGLNDKNVQYMVDCVDEVVRSVPAASKL